MGLCSSCWGKPGYPRYGEQRARAPMHTLVFLRHGFKISMHFYDRVFAMSGEEGALKDRAYKTAQTRLHVINLGDELLLAATTDDTVGWQRLCLLHASTIQSCLPLYTATSYIIFHELQLGNVIPMEILVCFAPLSKPLEVANLCKPSSVRPQQPFDRIDIL